MYLRVPGLWEGSVAKCLKEVQLSAVHRRMRSAYFIQGTATRDELTSKMTKLDGTILTDGHRHSFVPASQLWFATKKLIPSVR